MKPMRYILPLLPLYPSKIMKGKLHMQNFKYAKKKKPVYIILHCMCNHPPHTAIYHIKSRNESNTFSVLFRYFFFISSHSHQYYNHYQNTSIHCDMNEHHHYQQQQQQAQGPQPDLTFKDSDWSINKSPQPSFTMSHRDDLYSPVDAAAPSYSSYDNYENSVNSHFSAVPMNNINMQQPEPTIYNTMNWSSNNDTTINSSNNVSSPTNVSPSPGFCLPVKKPQQQFHHGNHFMDTFPLPPPSPQHQQQQYHLSSTDMFGARPYSKDTTFMLNKGERYHPRFKSANARLSPYTEQQDLYQRLLSGSSSSSPPQHYHPLMEEQTVIKGEEHKDGGVVNAQQQFYHNYQSEKEYTSSTSTRTDQT